MKRYCIQILSYNRPDYLKLTLDSLVKFTQSNDRIVVLEQSDNPEAKKQAISYCEVYDNLTFINLDKNLGQRGATNHIHSLGLFDDVDYVMISDQDNVFHEDISLYCSVLDEDASIWITSGYCSPEHDIEEVNHYSCTKNHNWFLKSTARAGHMVMRQKDFLSVLPCDEQYGIARGCIWFAG